MSKAKNLACKNYFPSKMTSYVKSLDFKQRSNFFPSILKDKSTKLKIVLCIIPTHFKNSVFNLIRSMAWHCYKGFRRICRLQTALLRVAIGFPYDESFSHLAVTKGSSGTSNVSLMTHAINTQQISSNAA